MMNILDYVKDYDVLFSAKDINELDSMIFAELTYCHFDKTPGITSFKELAHNQEAIDTLSKGVWGEANMKKLLELLSKSLRFREISWGSLVNKLDVNNEFEFNAITFQIRSNLRYIAYRGTTATKVGWKEDLNMSFSDSVPAHFFARKYFRERIQNYKGKVCLGGHSKGGNLAFYVGLTATEEEAKLIKRIDNFDGPGFHDQNVRFDKKIKQLKGKIHKFIPQASIVGILMDDLVEDKAYCEFVKSTGIPPMQHNLFNWEIKGHHFVTVDHLDTGTCFSWKTLSNFLENTSDEERREFIEMIYDAANVDEKLYLREMFTPKGTSKIAGNLLATGLKNQASWKPLIGKMWAASRVEGAKVLTNKKKKLLEKLKNQIK